MTLLIMILSLYTFLLAVMQLCQIRSDRKWRKLRQKLGWPNVEDKLELALRDFIVTYDNQIPLQLLAAYDEAVEVVESNV